MSAEDAAIVVKKVSKTFSIPIDKPTGIKEAMVTFTKRKKGHRKFKVLNDISFEIKKGEFFGIVGRNGSGKSTLLKLLAGIYVPDHGLIKLNGSLTPFIELGVGFNPELTARENVFLNGALLGFSKTEVEGMYDEIVAFAELGDFMAEKLKNFSSGMQVRLAFSIAIRAKTEILLLDEVLAVGDADFQKKCLNTFLELKREGRTIILVTHDMGNVERFCDRALVLHQGKVLAVAEPHEASILYSKLNVENTTQEAIESTERRWGTNEARVAKAWLGKEQGKVPTYSIGDNLELTVEVERTAKAKGVELVCGLAFYNQDGVVVCGPNSEDVPLKPGENTFHFTLPNINFAPGDYSLTMVIYPEGTADIYDYLDKWLNFTVISDHRVSGLTDVKGAWRNQ